MLGFLGLPGHWEIIIIVLAVLLLFGGKKLPELARGLGRGLRNFKEEIRGVKADIEESEEDKPADEKEQPGEDKPSDEKKDANE
ncbi:MAG: twin-arginine translocase TatA/TatE family subunit [Phycisphaerae bacterium]|jgi:sec-independent protein translocase protein TatA|nr:twin-arginine translocase TatA/TatE family subunit [Phycisphaerae bacterium]